MKKLFIFLASVILGPILGCLLNVFWVEGGNTFWKPVDYFPFPVAKIISMQPFGGEFWVETNDNVIYHILYPCEKEQTCWNKTGNVPVIEQFDGSYIVNEDKCKNDDIAYPLLRKIRTCITSQVLAPDANWKVSLVLTDNNELWIWQKPWIDPFTILIGMISSTLIGAIIGLLTGVFFVWKIR